MTEPAFSTHALFRRAEAGPEEMPARRPGSPYRPAPLEALPVTPAAAPPPVPSLLFSEDELARACAASAAAAAREAGETVLAARAAQLLERLAGTLEEDAARRRQAEAAHRLQLAELVLAALRRIVDAQTAEERVRPLAALLEEQAALAARHTVRVEVAVEDLAALETALARPGLPPLPATLELAAAPDLGAGALRASWPEGWLERDPTAFLGELERLLRATALAPDAAAGTPAAPATSNQPHRGDEP
ncbi:hypothetical protein SH611_10585 [Geminicoccaceae bacterium 1502E]|nr:hypothetical protein [Geminicoccaceae bacterium 1502E]